MKNSNVSVFVIAILLLVLTVPLMYFYYSAIAYPIEDPAIFVESEESLKDLTIIKEFNEYPIWDAYRGYLLETDEGDQKLIVFCKFNYLDQYQVVWETDVPNTRPCTVTIDFYGKSYDFTLDENDVFQELDFRKGAYLDVAPNDLMFMPAVGFIILGGEAAIAYGIYVLITKKKEKAVV